MGWRGWIGCTDREKFSGESVKYMRVGTEPVYWMLGK